MLGGGEQACCGHLDEKCQGLQVKWESGGDRCEACGSELVLWQGHRWSLQTPASSLARRPVNLQTDL